MDVYDSQDCYKQTIEKIERGLTREERGTYMPDPTEIEERKSWIQWLTLNEFSEWMIVAVMRNNHPTFIEIKKLHDLKYSIKQIEHRYEMLFTFSKEKINERKKVQRTKRRSRRTGIGGSFL